jgi:hypothetical protein
MRLQNPIEAALDHDVPRRHPERPRNIGGAGGIAKALRIKPPTPQEWELLGRDLLVGDPLADDLVAWMVTTGTKETRPMVDQATAHGIATVPDAPQELRRFFETVEADPPWLDRERINRAPDAFALAGVDGLYIARDVAFLGGYRAAGFNKTLIRTGALQKGSAKRFAETTQWAQRVTRPGGMEKFADGYRATIEVRIIHSFVRRHLLASDDWDLDEWGLPINQTDMAATMVGAMLTPFIAGMALGLLPSRRELEDVTHVSRYTGWLMGVEDRWLPTSYRDAVRILTHTLMSILEPDETTRIMAEPMGNDPLGWHFKGPFKGVRRRIARSQHLSITSAVLGPRAMASLGLPMTAPWYPLIKAPFNLVAGRVIRMVPPLRNWYVQRSRVKVGEFVELLSGSTESQLGEAASHLAA